jgi:DNA-binding NarL/FixJ family response regulator
MGKIRVLIADKREIFREGLAKLVEHEPSIEVLCTCRTGLKAIESAHEHQPDVILIDTELSECSSIETIQRIRERLPNTNIIVLSHSEANSDLLSAIRAGARAYISKDISVENLVKTITLVADGQVVVSPPMAVKLLAEFSLLEERKDATKLGGSLLLSKREHDVLALVAQGLTNREIAATLLMSEHTVKVHMRNIMDKLHAHTRQQAVALARETATTTTKSNPGCAKQA